MLRHAKKRYLTDGQCMAAGVARLRSLEIEYKGEIDDLKGRVVEQEREINDLGDQVGELEEQLAICEHTRELARIRTVLKSGKHDEGRERLERVLSDLDPAWRTLA